MRQQLPVLRFLARQPDPARDAFAGGGQTRAQALKNRAFATSCSSRKHPKFVSNDYLRDASPRCMRIGGHFARNRTDGSGGLRPLVEAVRMGWWFIRKPMTAKFMRTCTRRPKRNFDWRLETPERGYAADSGARHHPLYGLATGGSNHQRGAHRIICWNC